MLCTAAVSETSGVACISLNFLGSWKHGSLQQACGFRDARNQIEVLNCLTRGALDQVIQNAYDDGAALEPVWEDRHVDMV